MKILILKPSSLGDVIQALPVLRLLKLHYPTSEIYWWLDSQLLPLLEKDPDLHGVLPFHRRRWSSPFNLHEVVRSIFEMRRKKFDLVIDLQGLARSGAFAWLANGNYTIGVADSREGAMGFYDIAVARPSYHTHAVDWYLAVVQALDVPIHRQFSWLPQHPVVQASVTALAAGATRWIAINPGARWVNKRWPAEYFADLVTRLAARYPDTRFVVLGGREDRALGEIISRAEPERCLNLVGKTSLPETIEWIRRCDFIVTNDTGPMHIAAALGKPVIALFGPTEPRRTGPYGQAEQSLRISLPCSPCLKAVCAYEKPMECLRAMTPAWVESEIRRRIDGVS